MTDARINRDRVFDFLFDPERYLLQRQFAELQDIFCFEEIVQRRLHLFRLVNLAGFQARHQLVGGQVDVDHLVCLFQHTIGNAFLHLDACNILDLLVQPFEMLYVDSGNHTYSRFEDIHHILPAFFILAALDISMRQFVYNHHFRMNVQDSIQIHVLNFLSLVKRLAARNQW